MTSIHAARPPSRSVLVGLAAGLAAVAMWAAYLAFARAGVKAGLTPVDLVMLRFATAGAIMLPWLLAHEPSRGALFPALVPVAALIVGVPVRGEIPSAVERLGAVLATLGLVAVMGGLRQCGRTGQEARP